MFDNNSILSSHLTDKNCCSHFVRTEMRAKGNFSRIRIMMEETFMKLAADGFHHSILELEVVIISLMGV